MVHLSLLGHKTNVSRKKWACYEDKMELFLDFTIAMRSSSNNREKGDIQNLWNYQSTEGMRSSHLTDVTDSIQGSTGDDENIPFTRIASTYEMYVTSDKYHK